MRAIAIEAFGGRDQLKLMDLPKPQAGPGQILVQAKAAGVNPVDWKVREGHLQTWLPHEFPLVPGWDTAGVVEAVGEGVTRFKPGDEVFAYVRPAEVVRDGCYADYVALPEDAAALKPQNLSWEEAAAVPLAGLTAWQALFDAVGLRKGDVILIHRAAGGVGIFAVQLAHQAGATVIGTASPWNHDFCRSLGADEMIDYNTQRFEDAVLESHPHGVDVVFDMLGSQTQLRSAAVLSTGGRLVSILALVDRDLFINRGIDLEYVFVRSNGRQLEELAQRLEDGRLKVHLSATVPLEQAAAAHEMSEENHVRGKVALTI